MIEKGPALMADHAVTSRQIALRSFEAPLRPTRSRTGIVDGLGCEPARMPAARNTGTFVPDDFEHEIATSYVVKGRGLVVLTSCSHRGVVNSVRQAQEATGVEKLHAVIGGFHLAAPPLAEDYVRRTVLELKGMGADYLVPAHCAGGLFFDIARGNAGQGDPRGGRHAFALRRGVGGPVCAKPGAPPLRSRIRL